MVVGILRFALQIPASGSLKQKRQVVRKVIDRIRARYNVSVAEVADNDLWQKATLGVAAVGNDAGFVNEVLSKILHSIDEAGLEAWVVSHQVEIQSIAEMFGSGLGSERSLAEAEAEERGELEFFVGEELPTLDELEAAAEIELARANPAPGTKRRKR